MAWMAMQRRFEYNIAFYCSSLVPMLLRGNAYRGELLPCLQTRKINKMAEIKILNLSFWLPKGWLKRF